MIRYIKYELSIYFSKWKYGSLLNWDPTFKVVALAIKVREYAGGDN